MELHPRPFLIQSATMLFIRRSAFRAISSPSTSFLSKSRSITTSSPFITRTKPQATLSPVFRRFASNNVETDARESETKSTPPTEGQSDIASAISSATESASTYASETAESLAKNVSAAKDTAVDTASGVAAAAGLAYSPREERRESSPRNNYRDDRRSANPTGMNSERRRPRDFSSEAPALKPTNSVYIGNLFFETTEDDLQREFGKFGKIESVSVARDARNLSKGYGYITFDSVDTATEAIHTMNQTIMDGRRIVVNYQLKTSHPAGVNPPCKTLFIGNLAFEMSDADLNKLFRDIKNVMDVRVAIDRRTGQPRGFAHADFVDTESAMKGMEYLQGKEFYGRVLRIDYAASARNSAAEPAPPRSGY